MRLNEKEKEIIKLALTNYIGDLFEEIEDYSNDWDGSLEEFKNYLEDTNSHITQAQNILNNFSKKSNRSAT